MSSLSGLSCKWALVRRSNKPFHSVSTAIHFFLPHWPFSDKPNKMGSRATTDLAQSLIKVLRNSGGWQSRTTKTAIFLRFWHAGPKPKWNEVFTQNVIKLWTPLCKIFNSLKNKTNNNSNKTPPTPPSNMNNQPINLWKYFKRGDLSYLPNSYILS